MNLYASVIKQLLVESRVDTFARLVTRKIVQIIIDRIEKLDAKKRLIVNIKNLNSQYEEFDLKLTVTLKQRDTNRVNVAGSWTPALNELDVNVFFETESGLFDKTLLSQMQHRLYDTVRHEVEHSMQEKPANMYSDEDDDEDLSPESLWRDLSWIENYFLSDREISAFVSGLYHQAKRMRRPFIDVMDEKLNAYKKVAVHYNKGDSVKLQNLFRTVRDVWLSYAEQRFPQAIIQKMPVYT